MTALQKLIVCIWVFIGLGFVYCLGAAWGGWRGGLQAIGGLLTVIAWYGGWAALLIFTAKAIFGF